MKRLSAASLCLTVDRLSGYTLLSAGALADYPNLKAKPDYMAKVVRQVFGAVYRETKNL